MFLEYPGLSVSRHANAQVEGRCTGKCTGAVSLFIGELVQMP